MSVQEYLQGAGNYSVPDLVPNGNAEIELLIVVESPHIEEVRNRRPLSGDAGYAALKYLAPHRNGRDSLGAFVADHHVLGDARVAIMNTSSVPLQQGAFTKNVSSPNLSEQEWELIERTRSNRSTSIARIKDSSVVRTNQMILEGFQHRIERATLRRDATVVIAGMLAQRTWASLLIPSAWQHWTPLPVPHPAYNWWVRTDRAAEKDRLALLKEAFERSTS